MKLSELVRIRPGFKPAIDLTEDLDNIEKVQVYYPTKTAADILLALAGYLKPAVSRIPILIGGSYGTGKSHLGLMIAKLLQHDFSDPILNSFLTLLQKNYSKVYEEWKTLRTSLTKEPFLIVTLKREEGAYGRDVINSSLINALEKALQKAGLEEVMVETEFMAAIRRIEELESNYPEFAKKLEETLPQHGFYATVGLKNALKQNNGDALETFKKLHKEVCGGADFVPKVCLYAKDIYKIVCERLVDNKGYDGICIIWDEFSDILKEIVTEPEGNLGAQLQSFAEAFQTTGKYRVQTILISHRAIREHARLLQAQRGLNIGEDEIRKIGGRFLEKHLSPATAKEIYELMKSVIEHTESFKKIEEFYRDVFSNLAQKSYDLTLFEGFVSREEIKNTIVKGLYPLHPFTAYVLGRFTDVIGQRNRTMFTYLADVTLMPGSFKWFLENSYFQAGERLPFLTADIVFDFYKDDLEKMAEDIEAQKQTKTYLEAVKELGSDKDETKTRILKAIAILNICKNKASLENIAFILNMTGETGKIERILQDLINRRILLRTDLTKEYKFMKAVSMGDPNEVINNTIDERSSFFSPKRFLEEHFKKWISNPQKRFAKADGYAIKHSMNREMEIRFLLKDEMRSKLPVELETRDGIIAIVLTFSEGENRTAREMIESEFSEESRIIFILPDFKEIGNMVPVLRRLDALYYLKNRSALEAQDTTEIWKTFIEEDEIRVKEFLGKLLFPMEVTTASPDKSISEWYYLGKNYELKGFREFRELVDRAMENAYPLTPRINREELVDKSLGKFKTHRKPVIDYVLSKDGIFNLVTEKDSKRRHIIRAVYEDNDILRKEGGKDIFCKPRLHKAKEMHTVWEEIEHFIKHSKENFQVLIDKLQSPPYGLRPPSIPLILAAVMRKPYLEGCLSIKKNVQFIKTITADVTEDIVKAPHLYQPYYTELNENRKAVLMGIADIFEIKDTDPIALKEQILNWWQSLPLHCNRHTQRHISEEAKALRDDVFDALIKLETDPNEVLVEKLGEKLSIDFTAQRPEEIYNQVRTKLGEIKIEYESCLQKLIREVKQSLDNIFGDIKVWYQNLPRENKIYRSYHPEQVNKFLKVLEANPPKEHLIPQLAEAVCLPIEDWNDNEMISFQTKMKDYKEIVENYRPPKPIIDKPPYPRLLKEQAEIAILSAENYKKRRFKVHSLEEIKKDPIKKVYIQHLERGFNDLWIASSFSEDEIYSVIYHILGDKF